MKVAVVGATGLVGTVMLKVLEERNFPMTELLPVATEKSIGKEIVFKGKKHKVISAAFAIAKQPDIALFSAGGATSLELAPKFAQAGTTVIDNSSHWRMHPDKKLIVPEINAEILTENDKIIANPNCSTIQMVMALAPLHRKYGIKRIVVSTYQSITGTGVKAVQQMEKERAAPLNPPKGGKTANAQDTQPKDNAGTKGILHEENSGGAAYPYPIDKNCIPHCDVFLENGYTKEEMKLVNETRKIFDDYSIAVTATAVRVPVVGGHSEAVNVEFLRDYDINEVRKLLNETEGVIVQDNPGENRYPMPKFAEGKDSVFVGRIRKDESNPRSLNMWIVADNLRKGAATNAVQIAEYLVSKGLVRNINNLELT